MGVEDKRKEEDKYQKKKESVNCFKNTTMPQQVHLTTKGYLMGYVDEMKWCLGQDEVKWVKGEWEQERGRKIFLES